MLLRRCASAPPRTTSQRMLFVATPVQRSNFEGSRAFDDISTREQRANQIGSDHLGNQTNLARPPEFIKQQIMFEQNTLQHVKVPELTDEQRSKSDFERLQKMNARFGRRGPGEKIMKSQSQERRDMLEARHDIDGLPWEVRLRKENYVTAEEQVQDLRDRFELFIMDPIEREQFWYLHWNDREYTMVPDRLIWPQGFTDFFDRFDENGRRRHLPSSQKWSDSSWKMLVDASHRQRLYLASNTERKSMMHLLRPKAELQRETADFLDDQMVVAYSQLHGIVDPDPDQIYHAAAGSANPFDVKETKKKINAYLALSMRENAANGDKPIEVDPLTGLPKVEGLDKLPSGLTREQGFASTLKARMLDDTMQDRAEDKRLRGEGDSVAAYVSEQYKAARALGNQSPLDAIPQEEVRRLKEAQAKLDRGERIDGPVIDVPDNIVSTLAADHAGAKKKVVAIPSHPQSPEVASGTSSASASPQPRLAADVVSMAQELEKAVSEEGSRKDAAANKDLSQQTPAEVLQELEQGQKGGGGFIDTSAAEGSTRSIITDEQGLQQPTTSDIDDLMASSIARNEEDIPEWYHELAVEVKPVIHSYNLLRDPLEQEPAYPKAYDPDTGAERVHSREDKAKLGVTAFDEVNHFRRNLVGELEREYKPLPLFREVVQNSLQAGQPTVTGIEKREAERQAKLQRAMSAYDQDLTLPNLPWDTDPISDPYRGLAVDAISFNKAEVERVYREYKEALIQGVIEGQNMGSRGASEMEVTRHFQHLAERIRRGEVGERPAVDERIEEVFRLVFEAHTKEITQQFVRERGRVPEADAMQADANDILRRSTAKAKLLGKPFMDFLSEMTAIEMETIKQNPIYRNAMMINDKKLIPIGKHFNSFMDGSLAAFRTEKFNEAEAVAQRVSMLFVELSRLRTTMPFLPEVPRERVETLGYILVQYLRASVRFVAGDKYFELYLRHADAKMSSLAEVEYQNSDDELQGYISANKGMVSAPVFSGFPYVTYRTSDFLEGENGMDAELSGEIEKAERIFHTGTKRCWYPITDETDYMLFLERRGRMTMAMVASDRCIDNLNKKTHPSVHAFPERAYAYLEGAPLTKETAEHLWLRYMGDTYIEHAAMWQRLGRFQKAVTLRERGFNHYYLALELAEKSLPSTWSAIVLTYAKYLCARIGDGTDPFEYVKEVHRCMDAMYTMEAHKPHWIEPVTRTHYRAALVQFMVPQMTKLISDEAQLAIGSKITDEMMIKAMRFRAETGEDPPEMQDFDMAIDAIAERRFRQPIKRWIDMEAKTSDERGLLIHHYFSIRVRPKTPAKVDEYYEMYKDIFEGIYFHACISEQTRGIRLLPDAVRRLSCILAPGNRGHKTLLLETLRRVDDKLRGSLDPTELKRSIRSLEEHLDDPTGKKPIYLFNSSGYHEMADHYYGVFNNPLVQKSGPGESEEYRKLKAEMEYSRLLADGAGVMPSQTSIKAAHRTDSSDIGRRPEDGSRGWKEQVVQRSGIMDEKTKVMTS